MSNVRPPLSDTLWGRIGFSTGSCWQWLGPIKPDGYGQVSGRRFGTQAVHRVVYELLVEPIPAGLVIDHLCRNRSCVNPDHLEPVTHRENILRGISPSASAATKTHCPQGHEYSPANTYINSTRPERQCRACGSERGRLKRAARGATPRMQLIGGA